MEETFLAVDGNSLLHRAWHTQPNNPSGALQGTWNMLEAAVERVNPQYVTVALDHKVNYRKTKNNAYKATRSEKPESLTQQLLLAEKHFKDAGIQTLSIEGWEADDIIASIAERNKEVNLNTVLLTSDKDSFSLVQDGTPSVALLRVLNGGPQNWTLLNEVKMSILTGGITGVNWTVFAALKGDPSDNLPGVPGIGPKTAAKLLLWLKENSYSFSDINTIDAADLKKVVGAANANKLLDEENQRKVAHNIEMMTQNRNLDVGDVEGSKLSLNRELLLEHTLKHNVYVKPDFWVTGEEPSEATLTSEKKLPLAVKTTNAEGKEPVETAGQLSLGF